MSILQILSVAGAVVGAVTALGGIVSAMWAVGRVKGMETTLDLLTKGEEALRHQLEDSRSQREQERKAHTAEIAEERRTCGERIARLEGQMSALTEGVAKQIVVAVLDELKKEIP